MLEIIIIIILFALLLPTLYAITIGTSPVPTPQFVQNRMIDLAKIKPGDKVYDLGCGDGRLVFAAEKVGAKAVGFEISPFVFLGAYLQKIIRKSKAKIYFKDLLFAKLNDADTVLLYLYPTTIKLFLQKKLAKELKPGAKIISYAFPFDKMPLIHKEKVSQKHNYLFVYQIPEN